MELEWAESEIRLLPGVYACGASSDGVVVFVDPYHDAAAAEQAALDVLGILGVALPVRTVGGATAAPAAFPSRNHIRVPAAVVMAGAAAILVAGAASALATLTGGGGHHHIVAAPSPPPSAAAPAPVTIPSPVLTSPPPTVPPATPPPTAVEPPPAVAPPPAAPPVVAGAVNVAVRSARPAPAALLRSTSPAPRPPTPAPPAPTTTTAPPAPTTTTAPPAPTTTVAPVPPVVVVAVAPPPVVAPVFSGCQGPSPWESPEWRRAKYGEKRDDGCATRDDDAHDGHRRAQRPACASPPGRRGGGRE